MKFAVGDEVMYGGAKAKILAQYSYQGTDYNAIGLPLCTVLAKDSELSECSMLVALSKKDVEYLAELIYTGVGNIGSRGMNVLNILETSIGKRSIKTNRFNPSDVKNGFTIDTRND